MQANIEARAQLPSVLLHMSSERTPYRLPGQGRTSKEFCNPYILQPLPHSRAQTRLLILHLLGCFKGQSRSRVNDFSLDECLVETL